MNTQRITLVSAAAAAALVVVTGCGADPGQVADSSTRPDSGRAATSRPAVDVLAKTPSGPGRAAGTQVLAPVTSFPRYGTFTSSLKEMMQTSDYVFVGTVAGERRGPTSDVQGPDLLIQSRLLDVKAERVLKGGDAAAEFELTEYPGWHIQRTDAGVTTEARVLKEDEINLQVGDRGVFGIKRRAAGGWERTTFLTVFLFEDGKVKKSKREQAFAQKTEAKTERQVIAELEAAR